MQLDILTVNGIDTDGAVRRFAGKVEMYFKFLLRFTDDKYAEQLEQAVAANDYEVAHMAAHTLKGVAANLGVNDIAEECQLMVNALRAHDYSDLDRLAKNVRASFDNACRVIHMAQE